MGRLIDCDKLCSDLLDRWSIADKEKDNTIRSLMADVVTPIVASQPTVDAVPKEIEQANTDEILCKIKDRINQEIDELKVNGEEHSYVVRQNGLLIADGLRMALRIIREVGDEQA